MLKPEMVIQLNKQINLEFYSSNLYLQMSAWCEEKGFEGAAIFMRKHAAEEMDHMTRLFTYVSETGALPILGSIDAPPHEFESLADVFEKTYRIMWVVAFDFRAAIVGYYPRSPHGNLNFQNMSYAKLICCMSERRQARAEDPEVLDV